MMNAQNTSGLSALRTRWSRRAAILVTSAFVSAAGAQQGDPAAQRLDESPRHHEWRDVTVSDARTVRTWVVYPEVNGPAPAVVIIHENRGLNDWARSVADRIAEAGYVALAPDLLSGAGPDGGGTSSFASTDDARTALYELSREQVMADLDAVVKHARSLDATTDTVAVGGFCWGGGQTFAFAAHNDSIAAAYVFYGSAPRDESAFERIKAPVYGFYGGDDFRITGAVPDVRTTMKRLGKTYEPVIYDSAGHAFMRSGERENASTANRTAHDEAWKRWTTLLERLRKTGADDASDELPKP